MESPKFASLRYLQEGHSENPASPQLLFSSDMTSPLSAEIMRKMMRLYGLSHIWPCQTKINKTRNKQDPQDLES